MGNNGAPDYEPDLTGLGLRFCTSPFGPPVTSSPTLSDTDIARIADAVAERLRPSVLDVTPGEVRRWMGGRRV